jgi:hypothetical protein
MSRAGGQMRKTILMTGIIAVVVCFTLSCSSIIKRSDYEGFIQSHSNYTPDVQDKRLGVLPFECTVAFIGETISQHTAGGLKDSGFIMVDEFEMTQRLKRTGANLPGLIRDKRYPEIMTGAELDYLLVGDVQIYSPRRKRIISTTTHMIDTTGAVIVKVRFEPPNHHWKMPIIGQVLANEIKRELGLAEGDAIKLKK